MNEEFDKNKIPQPVEEQEIDLIELAKKVWANRKLVFKTCGIAVIVALVVAFSIPKEYATSVTLAPETTGKSTGGSMGALAAMAGVNLGNSGGDDALFPELYPDIVSSTPFLTELFDVKVEDQKGELKIRLYDYLDEHQRSPWWGAIVSAPFKALGWVVSLFKDEPTGQGDGKVNPFMLTKDEAAIADALSKRISVSVDKKTGVTTLSVTMQDPLISAALTDTVMRRLPVWQLCLHLHAVFCLQVPFHTFCTCYSPFQSMLSSIVNGFYKCPETTEKHILRKIYFSVVSDTLNCP